MTLRSVARFDFQGAVRSWLIWILSVLFVLVCGAAAWTLPNRLSGNPTLLAADTAAFGNDMITPTVMLASLIAVVVAHKAIAGERDSGRLKLLLTSPHTRRDVVFGKFVSRSLIVLAPLFLGLCTAAIVAIVRHDQFSATSYVLFSSLTVLFALSFVSLSLAVSSLAASDREATVGAFGLYFALAAGWDLVTGLVKVARDLLVGSEPVGQPNPDWFVLLDMLGPAGAYERLVLELVWRPDTGLFALHADKPWYWSAWLALAIILFWVVVPVIAGYLGFRATDL
ncbi:ABC-2 type transport system permease protein [Natronoarchaeum philippinense]|uniref:ABC-2 type transport system permease protein n=1 Tax=Natronoarchaeum philippinense TaxID=558529 RepID=A0A285P4M9_NATPI|nr:ABC transporter permease subunit [Natronoarchaeum philippinense]SNZ15116.1 ABC-2 type transport system permease protein [Natronoarchaeum philippinense]